MNEESYAGFGIGSKLSVTSARYTFQMPLNGSSTIIDVPFQSLLHARRQSDDHPQIEA